MMLIAMRSRGFGVVTALIKTEPVSLALLSTVALSEALGPSRLGAIAMTVTGVLTAAGTDWRRPGAVAVAQGLGAGTLFGVSALAFRAGILALPDAAALPRATLILVLALALQAALFGLWFVIVDRAGLAALRINWRASVGAGTLGALASQFWFVGFALTSAADVRTLALIEVPLAAILSRRLFAESTRPVQIAGMALIVAGVAWLIRAT